MPGAGSGKGRPSGPTTSTPAPSCSPASQVEPTPCADDDDVHPPAVGPAMAIDRRAAGADVGPPTAKATNWPGSAASAMAGAESPSST